MFTLVSFLFLLFQQIEYAAVDCTVHTSVCSKFDVQGYDSSSRYFVYDSRKHENQRFFSRHFFQPIKNSKKTNRELITRVFPRKEPATFALQSDWFMWLSACILIVIVIMCTFVLVQTCNQNSTFSISFFNKNVLTRSLRMRWFCFAGWLLVVAFRNHFYALVFQLPDLPLL